MAKKSKESHDGQSFEHSLRELEKIVETLESGEVSLEETLQKFEQGMKLVQFCHARLNEAEKRLKILVKDKDGNLSLTDEDET